LPPQSECSTLAKHICAKRFIVDEVADEFIALFANKINLLKQGDPMMEGINMGPLARLDLAEKLENQLQNQYNRARR
jgi:succinate-semialdehyde dehydrogenase/glutarate-semialdehyde dehydrogenase